MDNYNYGYEDGLKRAIIILTEELEYAKQVNYHLALGLMQGEALIQKELSKLELGK